MTRRRGWRFAADDPVVISLGSMYSGCGTVLAQPTGESPFYTVQSEDRPEPIYVEEWALSRRIPEDATPEQMASWLAAR
jgi:hypothetical protein